MWVIQINASAPHIGIPSIRLDIFRDIHLPSIIINKSIVYIIIAFSVKRGDSDLVVLLRHLAHRRARQLDCHPHCPHQQEDAGHRH